MDFEAVFAALPTAYLVLDADLRVAAANPAYLRNVGRELDEIVGLPVFEAFPPNPGDEAATGRQELVDAALQRVRDSGAAESLDILQYDIPDGVGGFVERFWSLLHAPVLDAAGRVSYILQRSEDVTGFVRDRRLAAAQQAEGAQWRERLIVVEADLIARGQELRAAQDADRLAAERLAALAAVALRLASARSVQDLVDVVNAGLTAALGADIGVLAISHGDVLRSAFATSVGPITRSAYDQAPLDGPLPTSVAAATGRRVVLRDRAESLAFAPEMAPIVEEYGMVASVSLPLRVGAELLGALTIFWQQPQLLGERDLELLTLLAAQCAQAMVGIRTQQAEAEAAAAAARLSETMQRNLLTEPTDPPGLDIAVRYQPAARELQVGGDWYDAFGLESGDTLLVVGDVAGHDQDAAAVMAQVRNVLRGIAQVLDGSPARVLTALDGALRDLRVSGLATAVLATIDRAEPGRDRLLRWSNAGHPPPVLIAADGTASLLEAEPDLLLGLDAGTDRADHELPLPAGSTLLLFTDGLVERRGVGLDDGLRWLVDACASLADLSADRLCDELLASLQAEVDDDVALLAVRVLPPAEEPDLVLARDPASVALARGHVGAACHAAGVDADTTDSALLLVSEVVTNAVLHGRGAVRLYVRASRQRLWVAVGDDSPVRPVVRDVADSSLGGRGMAIVAMLAAEWGSRDDDRGKVVWFELGGDRFSLSA